MGYVFREYSSNSNVFVPVKLKARENKRLERDLSKEEKLILL